MASDNPHANHRERVRQRFLNEGLDAFEPHQALELLLFYAIPQRDTNELAHKLLSAYGTISRLFEADPRDIAKRCGISENTAILISLMPQLFRMYSRDLMRSCETINNSATACEYAKCLFTGRIYEAFYVICLNKAGKVMHEELMCEGTIDEVPCYPRLVVETVLRHNAKRVIFAHNHPSGRCTPSAMDIETNSRLMHILHEMDIEVMDHIIVGQDGCLSMANVGHMKLS